MERLINVCIERPRTRVVLMPHAFVHSEVICSMAVGEPTDRPQIGPKTSPRSLPRRGSAEASRVHREVGRDYLFARRDRAPRAHHGYLNYGISIAPPTSIAIGNLDYFHIEEAV